MITAVVSVKPGQTRLDLAKTNAGIATEIVDRLAPFGPGYDLPDCGQSL
ncbi:hypothetical protein [Cupriavidus sp. SW-Y-13]